MTSPKEDPRQSFATLWESLDLSESGKKAHPGATLKPRQPPSSEATLPMAETPRADIRPTLASLPVLSFGEDEEHSAEAGDLVRLGLLGEGGMGRVELALQRSLRREVAVKSLKASTPAAVDALLHEALITGALEHPNIIPVHALGRDAQNAPLLVMKRIEGVSWKELLCDPAHKAWADYKGDRLVRHLEILMPVANALHFAHSRGIVHRDVKPENVMVGDFGEVSLVDWGVAVRIGEAQHSRELTGTPAYMAPEMLDGASRITPRTDVYLLGATLHEILTGYPPHTGDNIQAVLFSVFTSAPYEYGPEVPDELADICRKAMHPSPEERFSSAAEFRQAVADFLRHRSSVELSKEAALRLSELRRLLGAAPPGQEDATAAHALSLRKVFAECRFGFQQALREWEDNAAASQGLTDCLTLMVRYEIAQRNKGAAEALLAEIASPPPELISALEALRGELAEDAAAKEKLRALEHEQDVMVSFRQRARFLMVMGLLNLIVVVVFSVKLRKDGQLSHAMLLWTMAPILAFLLLFVFLDRKALLKTTINRKITATILVAPFAMLANRILALILNAPVSQVFAVDLLLLGVNTAIGGIALFRLTLYFSPLFWVAAFLAAWQPAYGLELVGGALSVILLVPGLILPRKLRT